MTTKPWKVAHSAGKSNRTIISPDGRPIATVLPCKDESGHHHAKENAAFFTQALNNYTDMLDALEKIQAYLKTGKWDGELGVDNLVDAVIKKAKGA